jgi:hypothetical protein
LEEGHIVAPELVVASRDPKAPGVQKPSSLLASADEVIKPDLRAKVEVLVARNDRSNVAVLIKNQIPSAHAANRVEWHPRKGAEHEGR